MGCKMVLVLRRLVFKRLVLVLQCKDMRVHGKKHKLLVYECKSQTF